MNDPTSPVAPNGTEPKSTTEAAAAPSASPASPAADASAPDRFDSVTSKPPVKGVPSYVRRHYVIDRRRQYRTAFLTSSMAAILLIIVNAAFTILRNTQSEALITAAPQLDTLLSQQDSRAGLMLILVSVIFVIGVFILTIAETHRTAGAILATQKALERVADGDYCTPLRMRPRDNLLDLRRPFNDMVSSLRKRSLADADTLDQLAADASSDDVDTDALADKLRAFAERKRDVGGPDQRA